MERGTKNHRYEPFLVIGRNEVTWQSPKKEVEQNIHLKRLARCARNDKQVRTLILIRKKEDLYNHERYQSPSRRPQEKIR